MSVTGLERLMRRFEQLPGEIKEDVRDIVEESILAIQTDAIRNAPAAGDMVATQYGEQKINTGINQFIGASFHVQAKGLAGEVFIEAGASNLAAYLEFGTGISAANYVPTLDTEWQAVAMRYYVNGKGTLVKHPFLLPAWFKHEPTVVPKIKAALDRLKL